MSLQEMVVKLRFQYGPKVRREIRKNQSVALAAATLITPGVVTAICLGFWKLGSDVGVAGQFAIPEGIFSHWQVWFALAGLGQCSSTMLNRYGSGRQLLRNSGEKSPETILDSEFTIASRR
jgi:hypothetical protein